MKNNLIGLKQEANDHKDTKTRKYKGGLIKV